MVLDFVPGLGIVCDPKRCRLLHHRLFGVLVLSVDDDSGDGNPWLFQNEVVPAI